LANVSNAFDTLHVAVGVADGIGFLGAGVIFQDIHNKGVAGLTNTACIWISATIGLAVSGGMYLISVVVTLIAIITLLIPKQRLKYNI
jgi:putative Mg2+ transporter-C (MgtC) family protein